MGLSIGKLQSGLIVEMCEKFLSFMDYSYINVIVLM